MNSAEYQLTVKSANQKVDDYTLDCRSDWTVFRLKQHISETHVNRPNIKDQRLIYAGNLLKDSLTLRQVFFRDSLCTELTNSNKTDFTIHLVCSNSSQKLQTTPAPGNSSATASQSTQSRPIETNPNPSTVTSSSSTINPNNSTQASGHNLNYRSTQDPLQTSVPRMSSTQASGIVTNLLQSEQMRQQLLTLQQLSNLVAIELTRNFAHTLNVPSNLEPGSTHAQTDLSRSDLAGLSNLGQAFDNSAIIDTNTPISSLLQVDEALAANLLTARNLYTVHSNPGEHNLTGENDVSNSGIGHESQNFNQAEQGQAQSAVPRLPQHRAQAPQAPILEQPVPAQPGVQAEPMMQRDVIDWVYCSIRALLFIAALYIHASLYRLLFILSLVAMAYFFSRRSNRRQNQAVPRANPVRPPRPADEDDRAVGVNEPGLEQAGELRRRRVNQDQPPDGVNNEPEEVDDGDRARVIENTDEVDVAQQRVSFLKLCYLVVADFLASLVPE